LDPQADITTLLSALKGGDRGALDDLFQILYGELRGIASRQLQRAASPNTFSTTVVVHEAYLKLLGRGNVDVNDRNHFFNLAALAMRQILVDHARRHVAAKRGGGRKPGVLDEALIPVEESATTIVALDGALDRLRKLDERLCRVVELRFFAGLSMEETAEILNLTDRTVKRDWRKARAFLYRELYDERVA
jgi:RNA polymerase sigma factor (TIGR02999 family)